MPSKQWDSPNCDFFLEESESQRVHSFLSDEPDGWGCLESRAHERSVGELGLRVRKVI